MVALCHTEEFRSVLFCTMCGTCSLVASGTHTLAAIVAKYSDFKKAFNFVSLRQTLLKKYFATQCLHNIICEAGAVHVFGVRVSSKTYRLHLDNVNYSVVRRLKIKRFMTLQSNAF